MIGSEKVYKPSATMQEEAAACAKEEHVHDTTKNKGVLLRKMT